MCVSTHSNSMIHPHRTAAMADCQRGKLGPPACPSVCPSAVAPPDQVCKHRRSAATPRRACGGPVVWMLCFTGCGYRSVLPCVRLVSSEKATVASSSLSLLRAPPGRLRNGSRRYSTYIHRAPTCAVNLPQWLQIHLQPPTRSHCRREPHGSAENAERQGRGTRAAEYGIRESAMCWTGYF